MRARFTHACEHAAARRFRETEFAGAQLELAVASVRNGMTESPGPASRAVDEFSLAARSALHFAHADAREGDYEEADEFEPASNAITALVQRFDAESRSYERGGLDGASFMAGVEILVLDIDRDLRATGAFDRFEPHSRTPVDFFREHSRANPAPALAQAPQDLDAQRSPQRTRERSNE